MDDQSLRWVMTRAWFYVTIPTFLPFTPNWLIQIKLQKWYHTTFLDIYPTCLCEYTPTSVPKIMDLAWYIVHYYLLKNYPKKSQNRETRTSSCFDLYTLSMVVTNKDLNRLFLIVILRYMLRKVLELYW